MTIKKRLFISNILMIIIPFIVTCGTMAVSFLVVNALSDGMLIETVNTNREILGFQRPDLSADTGLQLVFAPASLFCLFIAILYFTNRFLTRFVFRKIKQPLELLSSGVREISEGNLCHRIVYNENDEFKQVCEDFNEMAARLKASIEDVQKSEENRKELLAGISHDLFSPLTSIKGFVEGLIDGVADTPESRQEYLGIIKQKTDDISNMVSKLFFFSKIDMGSYPVHPGILNVSGEIADFVSASYEAYKAKGLSVKIASVPDNSYLYADPDQLRSIFANILDNSAKYKDKDEAEAMITCAAESGVVRIVFEDDGPGVPEDSLPRIFDVFYRNDPSRNNPHGGSGLGLAIAAKALERMDGRINAENKPDGGLRLIIEIPEAEGGQPR